MIMHTRESAPASLSGVQGEGMSWRTCCATTRSGRACSSVPAEPIRPQPGRSHRLEGLADRRGPETQAGRCWGRRWPGRLRHVCGPTSKGWRSGQAGLTRPGRRYRRSVTLGGGPPGRAATGSGPVGTATSAYGLCRGKPLADLAVEEAPLSSPVVEAGGSGSRPDHPTGRRCPIVVAPSYRSDDGRLPCRRATARLALSADRRRIVVRPPLDPVQLQLVASGPSHCSHCRSGPFWCCTPLRLPTTGGP